MVGVVWGAVVISSFADDTQSGEVVYGSLVNGALFAALGAGIDALIDRKRVVSAALQAYAEQFERRMRAKLGLAEAWPGDATLVRGSHGLLPATPEEGEQE